MCERAAGWASGSQPLANPPHRKAVIAKRQKVSLYQHQELLLCANPEPMTPPGPTHCTHTEQDISGEVIWGEMFNAARSGGATGSTDAFKYLSGRAYGKQAPLGLHSSRRQGSRHRLQQGKHKKGICYNNKKLPWDYPQHQRGCLISSLGNHRIIEYPELEGTHKDH